MRQWLLLDGSLPEGPSASIVTDGGHKIAALRINLRDHRRSSVLPIITHVTERARVPLAKLDGIAVVNGVGAFTTVRLMVAIANTLGWLLGLPILSLNLREKGRGVKMLSSRPFTRHHTLAFLKPIYTGQPNITHPRQ